jgi:chemotaxis protein MotB
VPDLTNWRSGNGRDSQVTDPRREAEQMLANFRRQQGANQQKLSNNLPPGAEEAEDWVVSYMDMITVLMIVFLGMVAIQSLKGGLNLASEERGQVKGEATVAGGTILPGGGGGTILPLPPTQPHPDTDTANGKPLVAAPAPRGPEATREAAPRFFEPPPPRRDEISPANAALLAKLEAAGLPPDVAISATSRDLTIAIGEKVLFAPGQAELSEVGRRAIAKLAPTLRDLDGQIAVEGHTDDVPISSARFASNWELSAARATAVLRTLIEQGVPAARLRAIAFADTRPAQAGPEGRAANRRVTLTVTGVK